jgi:arylsulfatase A-like enzyme
VLALRAKGFSHHAMPHLRLLVLLLAFGLSLKAQSNPPPNLIFILADDLGYGELGCYGQQKILTPHLDRMAAEGMRFTQFYAGNTVCAPSRSVLMTGLHVGHTRVRGNGGGAAQRLAAEDVTVARVLQTAGYATGLVGKWGLGEVGDAGEPTRQGFDSYFGYLNQTHAHNHFPSFLWRNGVKVDLPNDLVPVGNVPGAGYATKRVVYAGDLFATEAATFIERHRGRPFFLFLSVVAPHANNERSRELGDGNEVPDVGPYADRPWNQAQKNHAAMITRLDRDVGTLLGQLRQLGLDERTLVMFSSDNGPHREGGPNYHPDFFAASGPLSGIKRDLTDGGIRVPLIARWPGRIPAGAVSDHVGYFGDLMATWGELAGAKVPAGLDSISLVPTLLRRGSQARHPYLYWEFYEGAISQAVLLEGRWKGIRSPRGASLKVYDLQSDPGEKSDVAASQPGIARRLEAALAEAHVDNEHWNFKSEPAPKKKGAKKAAP